MIKKLLLFALLVVVNVTFAQTDDRVSGIIARLDTLAQKDKKFNELVKVDVNVSGVSLSDFLIALSKIHGLNINVSSELSSVPVITNFTDVSVKDLLAYLVKQYELDIAFTGNILYISKYFRPYVEEKPELLIQYDITQDLISFDLKNNLLADVFRKITDLSGINLMYTPELGQKRLTSYLQRMNFKDALEVLANTNELSLSKSKEGFYLFDTNISENPAQQTVNQNTRVQSRRSFNASYSYEILDTLGMKLKVDFSNVPVKTIIQDIGGDLNIDAYFASQMENIGNVTFKATEISFDRLLENIFESLKVSGTASGTVNNSGGNNFNNNTANNSSQSPIYGFKKEGDIYFFGLENQLSIRKVEVVTLQHRSVELLGDPSEVSNRRAGRTQISGVNVVGSNQSFNNNTNNNATNRTDSFREPFNNNKMEALLSILPKEVTDNLDITVDYELNSFLVSGPAMAIGRFRKFLQEIDKPIPVILIEVMILEVNKTAVVETGISWGIGDAPVKTKGAIFPTTDITLGAKTINRIIGGFDGFVNVGNVVPEFFATIKAMETNGDIKVRSTPKLSTLNGHRANLSIGETTYFVVTSQSFIGSQIPQVSEIKNFQPIDAELAVSIKPLVSGNGQITLDINVVQSTFNDDRINEDAPPGLSSREFSSIVRVKDQDIVVLGGLEEKVKNDTGRGVPLLSRIPIIKWLFSTRKREDSKRKLSILIKPTVIY